MKQVDLIKGNCHCVLWCSCKASGKVLLTPLNEVISGKMIELVYSSSSFIFALHYLSLSFEYLHPSFTIPSWLQVTANTSRFIHADNEFLSLIYSLKLTWLTCSFYHTVWSPSLPEPSCGRAIWLAETGCNHWQAH